MNKVIVYKKTDLGLSFYGIFKSIVEVSRLLGIHKSQISRCMRKEKHYNSAHGYCFFPCTEDEK